VNDVKPLTFVVVDIAVVSAIGDDGVLVQRYVVAGVEKLPVPSSVIAVATPLQIVSGVTAALAAGRGREFTEAESLLAQPDTGSVTVRNIESFAQIVAVVITAVVSEIKLPVRLLQ
jgi:hypothetical protein